MQILPLTLKTANVFIEQYHRHHKAVQGHKFSIGVKCDNELRGVAICGRPVSRHLDNGLTLEVTRLCTNGGKNVCSKLYATCARIAELMGYEKIITYTTNEEKGISLKASGWQCESVNVGGKYWNSSGKIVRNTENITLFGVEKKYPNLLKNRWGKILNAKMKLRAPMISKLN